MDKPDDRGAHLTHNRPLILLRSLLVGLCGVIPVPVLDDAVSEGLRRSLLRRIAQSRQVDIDEAALDVLCAAGAEKETVGLGLTAALGSVLAFLRKRAWPRRILRVLTLLRQMGEAQRLFQQATLFDHYCARHHVGPGIDAAAALSLRACFDASATAAGREALGETVEKALTVGERAVREGPRRLGAAISRALTRRQPEDPDAGDGADAGRPLTATLLHAVQDSTRLLLRDVPLQRYSLRLIDHFDRRYAEEKGSHGR
jgi:hypothetical protein